VNKIILLDAGPIGLITNPKLSDESLAGAKWLQMLIFSGRSLGYITGCSQIKNNSIKIQFY
jgi:hypothetical protein